MKDVETRLRDSLTERAEDAPLPTALATRARARLRRRRTAIARLIAGIVAAVVVVGAVPLVLAVLDGGTDGGTDRANGALRAPGDDDGRDAERPVPERTPFVVPDLSPDLSPTVRTAREQLREVTWLGIRLVVPAKWKNGATTAWCAPTQEKARDKDQGKAQDRAKDPARVTPRLDLPDGPRPETVCTPTRGFGVTVSAAVAFEPDHASRMVWQYDAAASGDEPAAYPDGAWVSSWYDDEWVVTVATPEPGLTSRIVRSVTGKEIDVNGCVVVYDEADLESATGPRGVGASLCSYTAAGLLEDSQRLTERETREALAALAAAPASDGASDCEQEAGWLVVLTPAGESAHRARFGTQGLGSCEDGVEALGLGVGGHVSITSDVVEALDLDRLADE